MKKNLKVCKNFTYYTIVKEAILHEKDQKATSAQIFTYITEKHPHLFKESNSMTWKGNIRQLLSKNPEFVKLPKDELSKLHYWRYVPLDEIIEKERESLYKIPEYPKANFLQYPNFYDDGPYRFRNQQNDLNYSGFPTGYYPHPNNLYGNPNDDFCNYINNETNRQFNNETNRQFNNETNRQFINQYPPNQRYETQVRYEPHQQNINNQRNFYDQPVDYSHLHEPEINVINKLETALDLSVEPDKNIKKKKSYDFKKTGKNRNSTLIKKHTENKNSKKFNCSEIFGDIQDNELISDNKIFNGNVNDSFHKEAFLYENPIHSQPSKNKTNNDIDFNNSEGLIRPKNLPNSDCKDKILLSGSYNEFFIANPVTSKINSKGSEINKLELSSSKENINPQDIN